jgi:hypothetical protein
MAYASLAELKTWIGATDSVDDHHLEPILSAAERFINRRTGRRFELETAATKLYYPTHDGRVSVVDLISATSIKTDSAGDRTYATTLTSADYELLPYADDAGRPSVRFQEIRSWPYSSRSFTPGYLVQVVGNFGYVDENDQTPSDIRLATLILAGRFWKRHETPLGILGATDLGQFERISKEDPDVATILAQYSRAMTWVVV